MAVDQVRINGNVYSWGSLTVKVGGERWYRLTSISYADKRERVKAYGQAKHQAPTGRSRGKYAVEPVKAGAPPGSFQLLRKLLATQAEDGVSYGDVPFDIVVQYIEADETPITVELIDCVWSGNTVSHEEGPDPLKEEVEFDCMRILRNGLTLFDSNNDEAKAL
jgi:hypothetical protein